MKRTPQPTKTHTGSKAAEHQKRQSPGIAVDIESCVSKAGIGVKNPRSASPVMRDLDCQN